MRKYVSRGQSVTLIFTAVLLYFIVCFVWSNKITTIAAVVRKWWAHPSEEEPTHSPKRFFPQSNSQSWATNKQNLSYWVNKHKTRNSETCIWKYLIFSQYWMSIFKQTLKQGLECLIWKCSPSFRRYRKVWIKSPGESVRSRRSIMTLARSSASCTGPLHIPKKLQDDPTDHRRITKTESDKE